jgi:hypothetical protein
LISENFTQHDPEHHDRDRPKAMQPACGRDDRDSPDAWRRAQSPGNPVTRHTAKATIPASKTLLASISYPLI